MKLDNENNKDFECASILSHFKRACADEEPNLNANQKIDAVLVVIQNDEEDVIAEVLFVISCCSFNWKKLWDVQ